MVGTIVPVHGFYGGLNGDLTAPCDGIPGIHTQIGQNLIDLGRVHFHGPYFSGRVPDQLNVFTDQPAQHTEHVFHGIVQIERSGIDDLFSGKGQQLFCQIRRPPGRGLNRVQVRVELVIFLHLFKGEFRMSQDYPQHVVEIMGHPAGQAAHGLHFKCLVQLTLEFFLFRFRVFAFGDVPADDQKSAGGLIRIPQKPAVGLHPDDGSILSVLLIFDDPGPVRITVSRGFRHEFLFNDPLNFL